MTRKYYSMVHITHPEGKATPEHDFGSFDKSDVDYEIEDRKDHGALSRDIFRKTWNSVPTAKQYENWIVSLLK